MCPNGYDHPWDNMVREGIAMHPQLQLVHSDRHEEADYIIYIPERENWMRENEEGRECPGPFPNKTIVLDETDTPGHLAKGVEWQHDGEDSSPWNNYRTIDYLAAFKRSFVYKDTSEYVKQMLGFSITPSPRPSLFPIQYPILQKFLREGSFPQWHERTLAVSTLLRNDFYEEEGRKIGARTVAQQRMQKYVDEHNVTNYYHGTNDGNRGEADKGYFEVLWETKILVTCNPSFWEGDHRTGEALAAGAMTLVDIMWGPRQFPLISGWHAVMYDTSDERDFMNKLDYYRTHDDEARKVAARGLYHAQRYFNTVTWVDYMVITAEVLMGRADRDAYVRTGLEVVKDYNHLYDLQQRAIYPWRQ
eukprot:TRINITY_DN707_c0_g1_i3.p1 TRINITY_DN707_c0_g1~~TRINITY_DN707_c0_g1_i3.p1  ORF type:complete len:361 (-),score=113.14 TRINITY_DN707_c0_g1_i3:693-1775(-)